MSIEKIVVVGAGTMGRGIAQVAAQAGYAAVLADIDADAVAAGLEGITAFVEKGVAKGKTSREDADAALGRLSTSTDIAAALDGAGLLVEAVFEDLDLKKRLFAEWDAAAPADCILASNTSSLPVGVIGSATGRPDRVIGLHFFNPVPIMKLLEIVRTEATSDETLAACRAVGDRMGKTSIVVKDSPGFATSRLGLVLGLEAIRMVESGVASAADIDTAMELGYRHPMGPLKLTDLVGLDVRLAIAEHLAKELDAPHFEPPALLRSLVDAGHLGRKSGEGFYIWQDGEAKPKA